MHQRTIRKKSTARHTLTQDQHIRICSTYIITKPCFRTCSSARHTLIRYDKTAMLRLNPGTQYQVTFPLLGWCCAIAFCMCWDTLCSGTGASKRCVGACCNSSALCNLVCADRSGMAAPRLLEGYLFSSTVLRFWLCFASHCWQIALEMRHNGYDLNVRICTKHCVFSGKRRFKVGSRPRRFRASSL